MEVLGFKRLAAMVVAAIMLALFAAQLGQSDSCSSYIIRMCNTECAGVKPFYPCYKECLRRQTCPPASAGAALLDPAVPGTDHKSTTLKSDPMELKD